MCCLFGREGRLVGGEMDLADGDASSFVRFVSQMTGESCGKLNSWLIVDSTRGLEL